MLGVRYQRWWRFVKHFSRWKTIVLAAGTLVVKLCFIQWPAWLSNLFLTLITDRYALLYLYRMSNLLDFFHVLWTSIFDVLRRSFFTTYCWRLRKFFERLFWDKYLWHDTMRKETSPSTFGGSIWHTELNSQHSQRNHRFYSCRNFIINFY